MPNRKKPATPVEMFERFTEFMPHQVASIAEMKKLTRAVYAAGIRKAQRDQKATAKAQAFLDTFRKPGETNAEAAKRFNEYEPERMARRKKGR